MNRHYPYLTLTIILIVGGRGSAQSNENKVEVGPQVTSLTLFRPDGFGDATEPTFGGRLTYNFNRKIAVEAEGNFFPNKNVFQGLGQGRAVQAQFGVKAGKRFEKFGVFAKIRPGFLSLGEVFSNEPGSTLVFDGVTLINARVGRKTYFTTDVGVVLELYPSARTIVRFDAGDTIIRYGPHFEYDPFNFPQLLKFPAKVKHNFQFTAGVGFRLGQAAAPQVSKPDITRNATSRFETGIQFTSLSVNHPNAPCPELCLSGGEPRPITEPGLGGRFTFNLTDNIALEAVGNYYPRDNRGHMFQSQFGVKAGKRFRRFGVFAKAMPGFVGFTKVTQLVGTHTQPFGDRQLIIGDFRVGTKKYYSTDIGGVVEFYVSHRVMTRMDFGDTIIHYSERTVAGFSTSNTIVRSPPETKHNFQYTAGLGFRF